MFIARMPSTATPRTTSSEATRSEAATGSAFGRGRCAATGSASGFGVCASLVSIDMDVSPAGAGTPIVAANAKKERWATSPAGKAAGQEKGRLLGGDPAL